MSRRVTALIKAHWSCNMSRRESDYERVSYRRLLSSFAEELDEKSVKKLSYIYCRDSNIDCSEKGAAFDLLLKIERLGHFSYENKTCLIQIAEDAGRSDWEKTFRESARVPPALPPARSSRSTSIPSKERQYLEDVHDAILEKCVALEERFQETWQKDTVTKEEGLKLLRKAEKIARELQSAVEKGKKELSSLPRSNSSDSSSGESSSGSELSTSPPIIITMQDSGERNRDKPMPKPRRPAKPRPYRPSPAQDSHYQPAVQETTRHESPMLSSPTTHAMNAAQKAHDLPPPIPRKRQPSPRLDTKRAHQQSEMCYTSSPVSVRLQKKLSEEEEKKVVAEESDRTGESGIGTGSGTTRYGTVAEWKEAMENPPEEKQKADHSYTPIKRETMEEDQSYEVLRRSSL